MLAFWGDIKALIVRKSADCKILLKRWIYSNRAVSNSNRTATGLKYSNHTKTITATN